MAKFIDPRKAQIIGGALAGGSLMEDEQEATSTLMGLGIGGFTGSMLDLDFKSLSKLGTQKDFKLKSDRPDTELELLKKSMLEDITERKVQLEAGKTSLYDHLGNDSLVRFDKKDLFNTITNDNLEDVIKDIDDLSTLKKVRTVLQNEKTQIGSFSPEDLDLKYKQANLSDRVPARASYAEKVASITKFFESKGYKDDALDKKVAIFSNLIEEDKPIILSRSNNEMSIGETKFKVSSYNGEGKLSTYMDSSNVWAVQKLNPFAAMYMKGKDGDAIATAIGMKFAEAADSDLIKKSLEEGSLRGMKPEDLKAILLSNVDVNEKDVDTYIEKAYQHQIFESGERARGLDRSAIENGATELAHRTSANTFVGEVIKETKDSVIDTESLIRPLGPVAKTSEGSELNKYLRKLTSDLGLGSSKHSIKGDNSGNVNTYGGNDLINVNSPGERNVSTTGSRTNRVDINSNSSSGTVRAFEKIVSEGRLPREYATSVATSRYTVDEANFNKAMNTLTDNVTLTVADGASIARREGFADYSHTMFNKEVINSSKDGKLVVSNKLQNYLDTTTKGMFPTMELPKLENLDELNRQAKKIKKNKTTILDSQSILKRRAAEGLSEGFRSPDKPSTKQKPERLGNIRALRRAAPKALRKPESILPTKSLPDRKRKSIERAAKVEKRRVEQSYSEGINRPTNSNISSNVFENRSFKQTLEEFGGIDVNGFLDQIPNESARKELSRTLDTSINSLSSVADDTTINDLFKQSLIRNNIEVTGNSFEKATEATENLLVANRSRTFGEVLETSLGISNSSLLDAVDSSAGRDFIEQMSNTTLGDLERSIGKLPANQIPELLAPVIENITQEQINRPIVNRYLEDRSEASLKRTIERSTIKTEAAEKEILNLLENTREESSKMLLENPGLDDGQRKSLTNLISSIDNKTPKLALQDAIEYRNQSNFKLNPGEYLGSDANGMEIKVSDRLSNYDLIGANYVQTGNNNQGLELIFKGERTVGSEGTHIKTFGASAKENNLLFSNDKFNTALTLAELESQGFEYTTDNNELRFKAPSSVGEPEKAYMTVDESTRLFNEQLAVMKNSDVAVISSADGVGLEMATNISKGFYSGDITPVLEKNGISKYIEQGLTTAAERLNISGIETETNAARRSSGWALGMMATALVEGKASSEAVMGLQVLGNKNLEALIEDVDLFQRLAIDAPVTPENQMIRDRGGIAQDFLFDVFGKDKFEHLEPADFGDAIRKEFDVRGLATYESFNAKNIETIVNGSIFDKEHVDIFRLAYRNPNESLMIGSADTSPTYNYGSGTMDKSMSYNAQTQLKHNGFGLDTIGLFGDHDKKAIYDINMITASNKRVAPERTLNHYFRETGKDSNSIKNFMDTIRTSAPEDIDAFLKQEGVFNSVIDNDFLYYNVENSNKENFKTLAIPKRSTDRVGIYETDAGHRVRKPLGIEIIDAAQKDLEISMGDTSQEAREAFSKSTATLKRSIVDTIGSRNNPAIKDLFALQAPNSSYSVILPASGNDFNSLVKKRAELGESVIGISETKAKAILKSQGVDPIDFSKYLDGDRILQTNLTDGSMVELIGLESREPTYSGNSVRPVSYHVFKDSQLGDTNTADAVFHSAEDKHYSKLMFGDYDLDHALVYNYKQQLTPEQYNKFNVEKIALQQHRNSLLALADNLSIKGADGKKVAYSLDLAVEETIKNLKRIKLDSPTSPEIKQGSKEFFDQVLLTQERRLQEANLKAGQRKITTPKITQLAMHLGESIEQVSNLGSLEATAFDKQAMRTMTHFLVENLIKNQHSETNVNVKQTDIEALIEAKNQFVTKGGTDARKEYESLLTKNFQNLLKTSSVDIQEQYQPHIEAMVSSELKHASNPKTNPTQVVDVPKNVQGMLDNDINHTVGVVENIISNTGLIETEDLSNVNIERTLKNGYNEVSNTFTDNLKRNAIPLAIGAGLLATGALMTQKDPDFDGGPSPSVRGDIGSMMLAPNVESQKQAKDSSIVPQNPARSKTGFITPNFNYSDVEKTIKQTARVTGSYNDFEQDMQHSMKRAIFGNNVSSVRIDKTYDY